MIGKFLSAPIRLLNVPAKLFDASLDYASNDGRSERILSRPLDALAKGIERAAGEKQRGGGGYDVTIRIKK